jgi:phosphoribosylanthranilate isomerase
MTLVKICGLTNFLDAQAAVEAGADFLGFIFYAKSPRAATPEVAARIMQAFDDGPAGVGVFVSPEADEVKATLSEGGLKAAQIHRIGPNELREVRSRLYGAAYAAIQPQSYGEALASLGLVNFDPDAGDPPTKPYRTPAWCPQLLVDAYHPSLHGGTGQRADLDIGRQLAARVPRLTLAGGLTPDNVAETIRTVRPWAVDVASGVETAPGKKDHGKVRAFIQAVRDVDKEFRR